MIILLDLQLPEVDGIEVLRRVRADNRTKLVPVVVLTSSRTDEDVIGSYARKIKVPTPMFDASSTIYEKALKSGRGAEDTAAVCAVLEKMARVKRGKTTKKRKS